MWKAPGLIVCLLWFIPAFAVLGAFAVLDVGEPMRWLGLTGGGSVGLVFGLILGGFRPRSTDVMFRSPDDDPEGE
jgi:hypothetical protein